MQKLLIWLLFLTISQNAYSVTLEDIKAKVLTDADTTYQLIEKYEKEQTPPVLPSKPVYDRTEWKLTLPVDKDGKLSGKALEINPIPENYSYSPYFVPTEDGIRFRAPVKGAKTSSNTKYVRTELRQMRNGTEYEWTVAQGGELDATAVVYEVPKATKGRSAIVIGQIHGPDDELARLYYEDGKIYYANDKSGSRNREIEYILRDKTGKAAFIPLRQAFDYEILVQGGNLTVSVVYDGITYSSTERITSFWNNKKLYFKSGLYNAVAEIGSGAGSEGTGQGDIEFFDIDIK